MRKVQFTGIPFRRRLARTLFVPVEVIFNIPLLLGGYYETLYHPNRSLYTYDYETRRLSEYATLNGPFGPQGRWSPDNRWIALQHAKLAEDRFQLALIDTRRNKLVVRLNPHVAGKARIDMISWSHDSNTVFFTQAKTVFAYDLKTEKFRKLAAPNPIIALVPSCDGGYAVATGGKEIVFHVYDSSGNPMGSIPTVIASYGNRGRLINDANCGRIRSSSSRRFCAFWVNDFGFVQLHVIDFRKKKSRLAYKAPNFDHRVAQQRFRWSPKEDWIITMFPKYNKHYVTGGGSVLITRAEDGTTRKVSFTPNERPSPLRCHGWAPDGRRVLLSAFRNPQHVMVLDVADDSRTTIKVPKKGRLPYFKPDGKVAFRRPGPMDR